MSRHPTDQRLRELLREGDPATDRSALSGEESAALRQVVLQSVGTRRPLTWIALGTAGAAATLAIVLLLTPRAPTAPGPSAGRTEVDNLSNASVGRRQIQFATKRGTQIIWVLDPELDL